MPRFFLSEQDSYSPRTQCVTLGGENAAHISRSLRMAPGEELVVCDGAGLELGCVITMISAQEVELQVLWERPSQSEPSVCVTLYQACPKGDKLELIVQKAVELGVCRIVPVLTRRCISRPDKKTMEKKRQRLQKIALEAAKQSGRGIIPQVGSLLGWGEALEQLAQSECPVLFYESQGTTLRDLMAPMPREVSILIGSEGGFDPQEVEEAARRGIQIVNLGPRILRCETAPLCALSAILYATGNLE